MKTAKVILAASLFAIAAATGASAKSQPAPAPARFENRKKEPVPVRVTAPQPVRRDQPRRAGHAPAPENEIIGIAAALLRLSS